MRSRLPALIILETQWMLMTEKLRYSTVLIIYTGLVMIAVSSGIIKQHRFADLNLTQRFDQLGTLRFPFNAKNPLWQSRCDGKTYGCFRPHVVYNEKNKNYVLWINVYDNVSGYRVFTGKTPTGPFIEAADPKLALTAICLQLVSTTETMIFL